MDALMDLKYVAHFYESLNAASERGICARA